MSETEIANQGCREMPDFVKKGLVRMQGGLLYLKAPYRVLWMRDEHPDWAIVTSVVYADYEKGFVVMQATIMDGNGRVLATAHSEENRGKLPFVKKAEMGAIARALGLCGYGTQFGELDDEELADSPQDDRLAERPQNGATPQGGAINNTDSPCSLCHCPPGKKHAKSCPSLQRQAA